MTADSICNSCDVLLYRVSAKIHRENIEFDNFFCIEEETKQFLQETPTDRGDHKMYKVKYRNNSNMFQIFWHYCKTLIINSKIYPGVGKHKQGGHSMEGAEGGESGASSLSFVLWGSEEIIIYNDDMRI